MAEELPTCQCVAAQPPYDRLTSIYCALEAINAQIAGQASIPVGTMADFAGSTAPDKWLLAYGQAVDRTTYASLFGVIGTTYGAGDGTTTFNLPDMRGRVSAAPDAMGGAAANRLSTGYSLRGGMASVALGGTGGEEAHVISEQELPNTVFFNATAGLMLAEGADANVNYVGGGGGHNTVQPTICINKIIYTGV